MSLLVETRNLPIAAFAVTGLTLGIAMLVWPLWKVLGGEVASERLGRYMDSLQTPRDQRRTDFLAPAMELWLSLNGRRFEMFGPFAVLLKEKIPPMTAIRDIASGKPAAVQ